MSKRERDLILENIEGEFRQDLAVHLYSTHLLHIINPYFPRRNWLSWPLNSAEVPDSRSLFLYSDEPIVSYRPQESNQNLSSSHESTHDTPELPEEIQKYRIRQFNTSQKLSDERSSLMTEIKALVEHRIHSMVQKSGAKNGANPEINPNVLRKLCLDIANSLDDVLERLSSVVDGRSGKSRTSPLARLLTWQDVLLAADDARGVRKDLYHRCERLFENVNYKFEYESDFDDAEEPASDKQLSTEVEELSALEAESDTDQNSPSATPSLTEDTSLIIDDSPASFSQRHLERLQDQASIPPHYRGASKIEKKRRADQALATAKKKVYYHNQQLDSKYSSLDWDEELPKKLVYRIEGQSAEENRRLAIEHGGQGLSPQNYLE